MGYNNRNNTIQNIDKTVFMWQWMKKTKFRYAYPFFMINKTIINYPNTGCEWTERQTIGFICTIKAYHLYYFIMESLCLTNASDIKEMWKSEKVNCLVLKYLKN